MAILVQPITRASLLRLVSALTVILLLSACDHIARDTVHIAVRPRALDEGMAFDARPSQAAVFTVLERFSAVHDAQCRAHIRRLEEWSCRGGTEEIYITVEPAAGEAYIVAEFTLIVRGWGSGTSDVFDAYVRAFATFMQSELGDVVTYPV